MKEKVRIIKNTWNTITHLKIFICTVVIETMEQYNFFYFDFRRSIHSHLPHMHGSAQKQNFKPFYLVITLVKGLFTRSNSYLGRSDQTFPILMYSVGLKDFIFGLFELKSVFSWQTFYLIFLLYTLIILLSGSLLLYKENKS